MPAKVTMPAGAAKTADAAKRARDAGLPLIRSAALAVGSGWKVNEYTCLSGPGDGTAEERHDVITVAAVVDGSFVYHGDSGRHLMHPGTLLAGNYGRCYSCGHDHGTGDRCIALHVDAGLFEDIAASAAGSARFQFPVAMLPARAVFAPFMAELAALDPKLSKNSAQQPRETLEADSSMTSQLAALLRAVSGAAPQPMRPSGRDERRINRALALIEERLADELSLDALAAEAAMSKYHFLRTFRKVTGTTPHGYILSRRIARAAVALVTSEKSVSAIAYDAGLPDLSTFNRQFRAIYAVSPSTYRMSRSRAAAIRQGTNRSSGR